MTRSQTCSRGYATPCGRASPACGWIEGYIQDFLSVGEIGRGLIEIDLKYGEQGEQVIRELRRASRPGRRLYQRVGELPRVCDGMGIAVVSTNRGVLSDRQCRKERIGGEVLCTVW